MKRSVRRKHLEELENYIIKSKKSNSRVAYEITCGYSKYTTNKIKLRCKNLHPWDYKNKYPNAVDVLTRICYPKNRDTWGRDVEKKHDLVKNLCLRENELIKRFRGLVRKYNGNERETLELLDSLFECNINKEIRDKLRIIISPEDSIYYDTIQLILSI